MRPRIKMGQKGFALIAAMILLVVITLLALGAMRGTTLQSRMAANLYDRGLAFQNAEAALKAAEEVIRTASSVSATSCTDKDDVCPQYPANTWSADSTGWTAVDTGFRANTGSGYSGVAQYHIDDMGLREIEVTDGDFTGPVSVRVYRVTVRTHGDTGRAEVVLQSAVEVTPKE